VLVSASNKLSLVQGFKSPGRLTNLFWLFWLEIHLFTTSVGESAIRAVIFTLVDQAIPK
jgi:hypothetical protein